MIPDLDTYDIVQLSSSGGKDSQAMVHYVSGLLRERGLLDRGVVVHADLGRAEWPGTLEIAEEQARVAGLRFIARARPQGDLLEDIERRGKFPTPSQRFCTSDHKRGQILVVQTRLADEVRERTGVERPRVLNCIGLRAEESPGRRRAPVFRTEVRGSSGRKAIDTWLPIHGWKEAEVWEAVRASGSPEHPAYAAGFPRASCAFCIFMTPSALTAAAHHHPELLRELVEIERRVGHRFQYRLALAEVAERVHRDPAPKRIEGWVM